MLEALHSKNAKNVEVRVLLAAELNNIASVAGRLGGDAEPYYRRAMQLRQKPVEEFPDNHDYRFDVTATEMNLSTVRLRQEHYSEAEAVLRRCLRDLAGAPAKLQSEDAYHRTLGFTHLNLGVALEKQNKPTEAAVEYAAGVREWEQLVDAHPQSVSLRTTLIDALHNLSKLYIEQGKYKDAMPVVEREAQLYAQLAKEFPENRQYGDSLATHRETLDQLREAVSGTQPK